MPNYMGFISILLKKWSSNSSNVFIHLKWRNSVNFFFERAGDEEYAFKLPASSVGWLIKYDWNVHAFFIVFINEILCEREWEMGI